MSTVLRLHTPSCIDQLERALFSLAGQRHGRIEPLILLQRFSPEDAAGVARMVTRLSWQAEADAPRVLNVTDIPKGDQRSELLNRGIGAATGDFVGFLDYDDYLYPNAYQALLGRFEDGIGAAMGGVVIARINGEGADGFVESKSAMRQSRNQDYFFFNNIYPIHSFLIRRSALDGVHIPAGLRALEDYHLLLQVLSRYAWDTELLDVPICEYVQRVAGRSTRQIVESDTVPHWVEARETITAWKQANTARLPVERIARLAKSSESAFAVPGASADSYITPIDEPLATPVRNLLPMLTLFRRRAGKVRLVRKEGARPQIDGEISPGKPTHAPQIVLIYRHRRRFPVASRRFIAALRLNAADADGTYRYSAPLSRDVLGGTRKGDVFLAYALCENRRLYRIGQPARIISEPD